MLHFNHFHVDLRPPERRDLPNNLLADSLVDSAVPTLTLGDLPAYYRELVAEAQTELQPEQGAFDMFVDLPPDVPARAPTLMLAESGQARKSASALRVIGLCAPMENIQNDEFLGRVGVHLSGAAADYFNYFERQTKFGIHVRTTLLQSPKNGSLEGDAAAGDYTYRPNPGFHGQDKVVALVGLGAYRVKVVYFIKVVKENERVGDNIESIMKYCGPKGDMWKISLPTTTQDPSSLQSLLSATHLDSSVTVDIADLSGTAVGTTTGTTITLDTTAAGHNWYIDYTPYFNDEYLPTSNPNEWIAKSDSAAAGLLSILLQMSEPGPFQSLW